MKVEIVIKLNIFYNHTILLVVTAFWNLYKVGKFKILKDIKICIEKFFREKDSLGNPGIP